jgi:MFS family permease
MTRARKRLILGATIVGSSMTFIDGSVVNVALPTIQQALGFDGAGIQWVINFYLLTLGALVLIGGAAADRFGLPARISDRHCDVHGRLRRLRPGD